MDSNEVKKSMAIAIAGGITISFAPTLYILSEANPLTGAFFRMFYALPLRRRWVYMARQPAY